MREGNWIFENFCLYHRKQKIVPGSLMKAVIKPGGGESTPSDGDRVSYVYFRYLFLILCLISFRTTVSQFDFTLGRFCWT